MELGNVELFHLSTSMCPAHRLEILSTVRARLEPMPGQHVICISTQLIEAGVDVDFGTVIRFSAGLDSLAQAAGRYNRNGRRSVLGRVFVVNPAQENLSRLPSIQIGKEKAERVLQEYQDAPERFAGDRIGPEALEQYYRYYFWEQAHEMSYPIKSQSLSGRADSLLNLLSSNGTKNSGILGDYIRKYKCFPKRNEHPRHFRQSFMTASKLFAVIDAPTQAILVPWGEGESIIVALCASDSPETEYALLRKAQRFSVNVFAYQIKELDQQKELVTIVESGLLALGSMTHYSHDFGLSDQQESLMSVHIG
jgi:CRISPR-associated endonuclease/helicase Cas3